MGPSELKSEIKETFRGSWWCTGLFLTLSFTTVSSLSGGGDTASLTLCGNLATFVRTAAFLAVALLSRRIVTLLERPPLLMGVAVAMGACFLARVAGTAALGEGGIILTAGLLAVQNGCAAVLYLGWMELYAQIDLRHGLIFLCLVHLLSAFLSFCLFPFAGALAGVVLVACLPLLSVAFLRQADRATRNAPYRQGERPSAAWSISPRPLVLLGTYTLTNTFLRSFLGVEDKAFVLLGVCVAALAVLVLVFRCFNTFELKALYQVSVPLLVAGAMFVLVGIPGAGVAAALCSNAAFTLFSIFITTAFCAISFRYGVNALWLFGITQAALTAGSFVGAMLPWGESLLAMSDVGMTATVAVLVVLLAALSMLLVSDRDFETTWGVTPRKDSAGAVSALEEEEQESRRCAKVARRYGLTRREEEILLLLMRGYTLSHIASELYVAESTMKTHSRHIYRKVGVANRQELQELLRAYPV